MKPAEWNNLLAPEIDWRSCYPQVAGEVRKVLSHLGTGEDRTTQELVSALYPEELAVGPGILARRRLFRAIMALAATDLVDCCYKGAPRYLRHTRKQVRPWIWHTPKPTKCCPTCGQSLPLVRPSAPAGAISHPDLFA